LREAEAIAREVGRLLLSYFRSPDLETRAKRYLDIVTTADTESERLIADRLDTAFPDDAVVGEEGTEGSGRRTWFVDPLDGTFNFARGLPFWCVSIGLVQGGEPVVGVVFDALHDELFSARAGAGAFLNGSSIHSSNVSDPMDATLQLATNFDRDVIGRSIADFNAVARDVMRVRNMGALALEIAYVGAGRLDVVAQRGSHPWDYAAAVVIAQAAGATVTELNGDPFDLRTDTTLVAATPTLHGRILSLLKAAGSVG
jgi:myo-inositol-1(or 4)-monophosphatase